MMWVSQIVSLVELKRKKGAFTCKQQEHSLCLVKVCTYLSFKLFIERLKRLIVIVSNYIY